LLITDLAFSERHTLDVIDHVARALPEGDFAVQLRDKGRDPDDRARWARELRAFTRERGVGLVVNGDVGLARAVLADGVHFGAGGIAEVAEGEGLWRSVAAHSDEDVVRAARLGVDAALVSPIFASPGKGEPRGLGALRRAVELASGTLGVIALGGIGVDEAGACFEAGAGGVAMIRGLLGARAANGDDVARAIRGADT
jgi:thiamine-phosphate pyrophosphorylase